MFFYRGRGDTFGTVKKSSGGASKSQRNVLEKIDAIYKRLDKVMVETSKGVFCSRMTIIQKSENYTKALR